LIGPGHQTRVIEIIDLDDSSLRIQNLPDFPISTIGARAGLNVNEDPLICGGLSSMANISLYSSLCYSYEAQGWNDYYFLSRPKGFSATAFNANGEWYCSGGLSYDNVSTSTTELLTRDGWKSILPDLPVKLSRHCMAFINSTTMIIIGGSQPNSYFSSNTFLFNMDNQNGL
jgi:hypothetical protein